MSESRQVRPLASEPPRQAPHSPYLLAQEAAQYLRFASVRALYKALAGGLDLPVRRRGRTLLFHRDDLDRWLAGESRLTLLRDARARHVEQSPALRITTPRQGATR